MRIGFPRLLIVGLLAVVGAAIFAATAKPWVPAIVYFVGDSSSCSNQIVQPLSDQADNGYSYNHESDAWTLESQCSNTTVPGYLRAYLINTGGTWCDGYAHSYIYCQLSDGEWIYTRAHCQNMSSSSSRWMQCYKVKQSG